MITIQKITLSIQQVAGSDIVLIKDVRPYKAYENGQATDVVQGFRYTVIAPSNKYEEFAIKIEEDKPFITPEELDAKGGLLKVKVKGLEGRFFRNKAGEYTFTSTASSFEVIQ